MYKGESPIPTVKEQENSQLLTSSVQIPLLSSPISAPQSCCLFSLYFVHPSDVRSIFLLSIKSGKKGPEARLTGSITASAPNACPALAAILNYVDSLVDNTYSAAVLILSLCIFYTVYYIEC